MVYMEMIHHNASGSGINNTPRCRQRTPRFQGATLKGIMSKPTIIKLTELYSYPSCPAYLKQHL